MHSNQSRPTRNLILIATLVLGMGLYSYLSGKSSSPSGDSRRMASEDNPENDKVISPDSTSSDQNHNATKSNQAADGTNGRVVAAASPEQSPEKGKIYLTNKEQVDAFVQDWMTKGSYEFEFDATGSQFLSDSVFKIYRYQQKYQGYPVYAAEMKVFIGAETSQLIRTQSTFVNIDQLPPQNYMNADQAVNGLASSADFTGKQVSLKSDAVELFVKDQKVHFIYSAEVQVPNQIGTREVVIFDANTGQVVTRFPTSLK